MGIIQAIIDFSGKYMVPINSESFKTPSLTPNTLPNSKQNIVFIFFENLYSVREFWALLINKKQELHFNFQLNPSIHLYKHTSHEIVC